MAKLKSLMKIMKIQDLRVVWHRLDYATITPSSISGELSTFSINGYNYVAAANYKISTNFDAVLHQAAK
jgi:hypothetical protein